MKDGFAYEQEKPFVFLQYKNTDACFDFYCKCGEHHHVDGFFAGHVKCMKCSTMYQLPWMLHPREVTSEQCIVPPIEMHPEADE